MSVLYELAVLGTPTDNQLAELESIVGHAVQAFGLRLGHEVGWSVRTATFTPDQRNASAAVFFGAPGADATGLEALLQRAIPVLPVVSDTAHVRDDLPDVLRHINCLNYHAGGAQRVATGLLECAGLLPRQRRVFLSYRRDEARQAALQLFDAFTARLLGL